MTNIRKYLLISAMLLVNPALMLPTPSIASNNKSEVLVLTEKNIKVYGVALDGFRSVCNAKINVMDIGTEHGEAIIYGFQKVKPLFMVAVGDEALAEAIKVGGGDIPIVFMMALNPSLPSGVSATGVSLTVSIDDQFRELTQVLPSARRIGVLYCPQKTGGLFKKALKAAAERGLTLKGRAINTSGEIVPALEGLKGQIDVLWMLPDSTVLTYDTVKYLTLYSFENKIPIFALSKKYVESGALMALDINPYDIGKQVGEMANELLAGKNIKSIPPAHTKHWKLYLNLYTAKRMGITLMKEVLKSADKIY